MSDVPTVNEGSPGLDESCEPLAVLAPAALEPGEIVPTPDGSKLLVGRLVKSSPLYNVYEVTTLQPVAVQAAQDTPGGEEALLGVARAEAATGGGAIPVVGEAPVDGGPGEGEAPADGGIESSAGAEPAAHTDVEPEGPADAGSEPRADAEPPDPADVGHQALAEVGAESPPGAGPMKHAGLERAGATEEGIEPLADAGGEDGGESLPEAPTEPPAEAGPAGREGAENAGPPEGQAGPGEEDGGPGETLWLTVSADPSQVRQMEHAFDVLSALEAPDTPRVRHIFPLGAQTCLVGEDLEGDTLADAMARGHLDTRSLLSVVARAALAVSRLHEQGWLHLALRPEALLLLEGSDRVKLLDFSRAIRVGTSPEAPFHLPGYSAPELATGGPVGAQADVYGLGALLYRLTCGSPIPETGVELRLGSLPCEVAGVPQILARCLDADPDRRYQAASHLHRDLLRLLWRMRPGVVHHVDGATTIGLDPGRRSNQDSWGFLCGRLQSEERASTWSVFCVADGMGGMEAGDVASRTAISTLLSEAASWNQRRERFDGEEQMATLKRWTFAANARVIEALQGLGARGGTTLVCGFVVDRRLVIGHVGDSRAYLFRQGKCIQLTRDHSLAMMMVLQGQASLEEIRTNPDRNRVTRSLGDRHPLPDWYVDSLQTMTGHLVLDLEPDDVVVLCSDGLWEPVLEEQVDGILAEHRDDPGGALADLIIRALAAGAPDNATVVLFQARARPTVSTPSPRKDAAPWCSPSS